MDIVQGVVDVSLEKYKNRVTNWSKHENTCTGPVIENISCTMLFHMWQYDVLFWVILDTFKDCAIINVWNIVSKYAVMIYIVAEINNSKIEILTFVCHLP